MKSRKQIAKESLHSKRLFSHIVRHGEEICQLPLVDVVQYLKKYGGNKVGITDGENMN